MGGSAGAEPGPCRPARCPLRGTASPPCPGALGTSSSFQSSRFSSRFLPGHGHVAEPPEPPTHPLLHPVPTSRLPSLRQHPHFPAECHPLPPWRASGPPALGSSPPPLPAGRRLQPQVGHGLIHGQQDVDVGEGHGQGQGTGVVAVLDADPRGPRRAVPPHAEPQRRRAGAQPRELGRGGGPGGFRGAPRPSRP